MDDWKEVYDAPERDVSMTLYMPALRTAAQEPPEVTCPTADGADASSKMTANDRRVVWALVTQMNHVIFLQYEILALYRDYGLEDARQENR
mmetsp:Transcript_45970/g.74986  ORF Transcript_45970/g.74986 Transcript_45970/m.74986 type:complete len:91 (-) Transcript_45970:218-490(-)